MLNTIPQAANLGPQNKSDGILSDIAHRFFLSKLEKGCYIQSSSRMTACLQPSLDPIDRMYIGRTRVCSNSSVSFFGNTRLFSYGCCADRLKSFDWPWADQLHASFSKRIVFWEFLVRTIMLRSCLLQILFVRYLIKLALFFRTQGR